MQNIPLVVASPGSDQPELIHGKEIQALTSTPRRKNLKKICNLLFIRLQVSLKKRKLWKQRVGLRRTGRRLGKGRNRQIVTPSPQNPSRPGRMCQSSRQSQNDQQNDSENRPPIWNTHYGKVTWLRPNQTLKAIYICTRYVFFSRSQTRTPFYLKPFRWSFRLPSSGMSEPNSCHCYVDGSDPCLEATLAAID